MSKKDKPNSRWNAGNERYPATLDLSKYREGHGWRRGAKIKPRRSK